jgi:hypothetical protein
MRRLRFSSGVWAVMVVLAGCTGNVIAPAALTPASSPSPAQTESASPASPTTERVHFAVLPPEGSHASTPAIGKLVLSLREYGTNFSLEVDWNVYADGRMIWQKWGHSAYAGVVPEGANKVDTGYVERRLTPQGVQLLRSRILSTGLFEHRRLRLHAGRHHAQIHIRVLESDRWVSVEASPKPYRSWRKRFTKETPAQGRALARLVEALLAEPTEWLPATAWADPEMRAFVPSRYWFAYDRSAPDTSRLPSLARELLQAALSNPCSVATTDEARAIFQALAEAGIPPLDNQAYGIGFVLPGMPRLSYLHFHPALPGMKPC